MKTLVKAIESMLAQDATQQWTAAARRRLPALSSWNWA